MSDDVEDITRMTRFLNSAGFTPGPFTSGRVTAVTPAELLEKVGGQTVLRLQEVNAENRPAFSVELRITRAGLVFEKRDTRFVEPKIWISEPGAVIESFPRAIRLKVVFTGIGIGASPEPTALATPLRGIVFAEVIPVPGPRPSMRLDYVYFQINQAPAQTQRQYENITPGRFLPLP